MTKTRRISGKLLFQLAFATVSTTLAWGYLYNIDVFPLVYTHWVTLAGVWLMADKRPLLITIKSDKPVNLDVTVKPSQD
jgi:hypothetical protein